MRRVLFPLGTVVAVTAVVAVSQAGIASAQETTKIKAPSSFTGFAATTSPSSSSSRAASSSSVPTDDETTGESSTPLTSTVEVPTSSPMTSEQASSSVALPEGQKGCPAVQLVAVNGTSDAGKNSSTTSDTGWMSQIAKPATEAANADGSDRMGRVYVPYPASYGGMTPGKDTEPYAQSMLMGIDNGKKLIEQTLEKCPETKIFVSGYSQGAQVASAITRDIGAGKGPAKPDQFAGAALMSDPTRQQGAGVFPAENGRKSPGPVPGTEGDAVGKVDAAGSAPTAPGGGIAPNTAAADFGAVGDRVASFCVPGDIACDTSPDSDLLKLVANISGQSKVDPGQLATDPVKALADVATVTGQSVLFTGADTINEDVNFSPEEGFTIAPAERDTSTLSRMVKNSDPTRADKGVEPIVQAVTKIGGMALGAGISVARDVLTPANLAEIMAAGVANPAAGAAVLASKLVPAASKLVTPATVDSGMKRVSSEIEQTVKGNEDLTKIATDASSWQAIGGAHGSYASTPFSGSGQTPAGIAKQWTVAAANDIAASRGEKPSSKPVTGDRIDQIKSGHSDAENTGTPAAPQAADAGALHNALAQVA